MALVALGFVAVALAVVFRSEIKNAMLGLLVPPSAASGAEPGNGTVDENNLPFVPTEPEEDLLKRPDETQEAYFSRMESLAEVGDSSAQVSVADACFHGKGTPTNRVAAVEWYRKAADAGEPAAQASLAFCLLNGLGCERNVEEAADWYAKGAAQEDLNAINGLAFCYLNGLGVDKDERKGFGIAMKAAVRGHAPSQTLVGECFFAGRGVERDQERGEAWLYRATRQNNKRAEILLQAY